ncbi:hypothetical protein JCM9279_000360 [Rhodotorula babjevae]
MSDAGTRKKKPPACDFCKAKRVLCHPSAQGCPRCLEKGIDCTTTPVVRRKPVRKKQFPDGSHESSVEPTTATSSNAAPGSLDAPTLSDAPQPAEAPPLLPFADYPPRHELSQVLATAAPAGAAPPPSSSSEPLLAYHFSAAPPPSFETSTSFQPHPVASTSQVPYTSTALALNSFSTPSPSRHITHPSPQLARHLLECFRNTSLWDHPLARNLGLHELLETAEFDLDRLDVQAHVCAYVAFAIGSLVSYDPLIIGDGPGATSFKAMETLVGELKDLRDFGRRRRAAFETMRDHALKIAREADILVEPSRLNAMSCAMLDYLTGTGEIAPPSRPFLGACMSHVRVLCDSGELDNEDGPRTVWAMGLSHDMLTEIASGRLTSTPADQLALVGALDVDLDAFEEQLRSWMPNPQLQDVLHASLQPLALAHLAVSRELAGKILSTHARRQPLDEAALAHILARLHRFRTVSALLVDLLDKLIEVDERPIFPHAAPKRVRFTTPMVMRAIRGYAATTGSVVVVPLYRELRRRLVEAQEALRISQGAEREEKQALVERLELVVRQFSRVFVAALRSLLEAMERSPSLLLAATLRKIGVVDWGSILLQEVESGSIALDDNVADLFQKVSDLAKISGYSYSSSTIDALLDRLDVHVAAHRSPSSTQLGASTFFGAPLGSSSAAAAARPFDFAFLSELSNSAENSPDAIHPLATTSAPPHVPMQGLSSASAAAAAAAGGPSASLDAAMGSSAPFDLCGLDSSVFDPSSAFGTQAMPTFSPEQLAQLLGASAGGEGQGDVDAFAGWAAW